MDLAFSRFASPYLLLNDAIKHGHFEDMVTTIFEQKQEEQLINIWLHKEFEKSYKQFKDDYEAQIKNENVDVNEIIEKASKSIDVITPD